MYDFVCKHCRKKFRDKNYSTKRKYCSKKCYWLDKKGEPSKRKGKKFPQISGRNHYNWKGKEWSVCPKCKNKKSHHAKHCLNCYRNSIRSKSHKKECPCCKSNFETNKKQRIYCSMSCAAKQTAHKRKPFIKSGKEHPHWKGDEVSYRGLHAWVAKKMGQPNQCEHCGEKSSKANYEWANKTGKYKRRKSDWIRLCKSCHWYYDRR